MEQEKARSPHGLRAEVVDCERYCRRARKSPAPARRRPRIAIIGNESVGTGGTSVGGGVKVGVLVGGTPVGVFVGVGVFVLVGVGVGVGQHCRGIDKGVMPPTPVVSFGPRWAVPLAYVMLDTRVDPGEQGVAGPTVNGTV